MKQMWDSRYAEPEYVYGEAPNAYLAAQLGPAPQPGVSRVLMPAEGEGRNAVHAARAGWRVSAFDISAPGRDKALALAARHGVEIDYAVTSYADAQFEVGAYDALVLIFAHMHERMRRDVHRNLCTALAPGGRVLLEAYSKAQLNYRTGGPRDAAMLYDLDEAREDFAGLEIVRLEQVEAEIVEGKYHTGLASVVRLEARVP